MKNNEPIKKKVCYGCTGLCSTFFRVLKVSKFLSCTKLVFPLTWVTSSLCTLEGNWRFDLPSSRHPCWINKYINKQMHHSYPRPHAPGTLSDEPQTSVRTWKTKRIRKSMHIAKSPPFPSPFSFKTGNGCCWSPRKIYSTRSPSACDLGRGRGRWLM